VKQSADCGETDSPSRRIKEREQANQEKRTSERLYPNRRIDDFDERTGKKINGFSWI